LTQRIGLETIALIGMAAPSKLVAGSKRIMTRKKPLGNGKRVGLKLSIEERQLILGKPIHIHEELADAIRATATGDPVLLTLDVLEDLGVYVAAAAGHTTDEKFRKKLDAIFSKIEGLLDTSADDEPSLESLKNKNSQRRTLIGDKVVEMAELAAKLLIGAEQLGIKEKPVAPFPLPWSELAALLVFARIDNKTLKKLEAEQPILTVGEIGGLLMAAAEAMIDASGSQCSALSTPAKSLMNCLEEEVTGAIKP
jgi:hypothetical protein